MRYRYWFFSLFLVVLYIGAGLVVFLELKHGMLNLTATHWLSFVAVIAALTQWALTSVLTLYSARRQHTISVLLQSRLSPAYQQRMRDIVKIYPTMPTLTKVAIGDWDDPQKMEALEGVKYLLNYFEFVAIGIRTGDLDEKTLRRSLNDIVAVLTEMAHEYIRFARGELQQTDGTASKRAYEELLWLKKRWKVHDNLVLKIFLLSKRLLAP